MKIQFKRYFECAATPIKMTKDSAGKDIFSSETKIFKARLCELMRTDLQ